MASDTGTPVEARHPAAASAALIGKSVVVKGELEGSEDLTIEGQVEGKIELRDHTLTIGQGGRIKAQVFAKAVVVLRRAGRQHQREREASRSARAASVDGDIVSPRVAIADGAHFRGSIDMQRKGPAPAKGGGGAPEPATPWKMPPSYGALAGQGADRVGRREQRLAGRPVEPGSPVSSRRRRARPRRSRPAASAVRLSRTPAGRSCEALARDAVSPVVVDLGPVIGSNVELPRRRASPASSIPEDLYADVDQPFARGDGDGLGVRAGGETAAGARSAWTASSRWDVFDYLGRGEAAALSRTADALLRPGGLHDGAVHDGAAPRGGLAPLRHRRRRSPAAPAGAGRPLAPARCGRCGTSRCCSRRSRCASRTCWRITSARCCFGGRPRLERKGESPWRNPSSRC
ncbi:MAG: polymer-forming cytoskeletal protein [Ignavibacteriales bacterium]|nr:polymer-forming cytoskeletal protein [Ignavibacteriales bacterium]